MHTTYSTHRGSRARTRIALAALCLLGLAVSSVVLAAPAAAAGTVTVTPDENLTDGQQVTVSGSGFPSGSLAVIQCGNATSAGEPLPGTEPTSADCHGANQLGSGTTLVEGPSFSTPYTVSTDNIGDNGRRCIPVADANFACLIAVASFDGTVQDTADILFTHDAPPGDDLPPAADTSTYCENADANPFPDVSSNEDDIACLASAGITEGYDDGTYRPGLAVPRAQMASFLIRLGELVNASETESAEVQDIPSYDGTNEFTDVDEDSVHKEAINRLAEMGVTTGKTATTFDPTAPVSRAQMATFINRLHEFLTGQAFDAGQADYFNDDDDQTNHEANINGVASAGIAQGTAPSTFSPGASVTRSQMASFLVRYLAVLEADDVITPLPAE